MGGLAVLTARLGRIMGKTLLYLVAALLFLTAPVRAAGLPADVEAAAPDAASLVRDAGRTGGADGI